jgi:hypothetical protein
LSIDTGCSAIVGAAPVCRLLDGHSSSGQAPEPRPRAAVVVAAAEELDVVDDPHAVAQAVRAADLHGLPDAGQAERLAGVDRHVEVLAVQVVERVEVPRGRVAGLGAGDVEADDAVVAVPHGELGDLAAAGRVPHRRDEGADPDRRPALGRLGHPVLEALLHGRDDLVEGQPALEVLLGGVPHLGVDDAVRGEVERALAGDPGEVLGGLHHGDRVHEGLEVALEGTRARLLLEPLPQRRGPGRRQLVADLPRELDDRRGPQAAVQVVVQQRLGRGDEGRIGGAEVGTGPARQAPVGVLGVHR